MQEAHRDLLISNEEEKPINSIKSLSSIPVIPIDYNALCFLMSHVISQIISNQGYKVKNQTLALDRILKSKLCNPPQTHEQQMALMLLVLTTLKNESISQKITDGLVKRHCTTGPSSEESVSTLISSVFDQSLFVPPKSTSYTSGEINKKNLIEEILQNELANLDQKLYKQDHSTFKKRLESTLDHLQQKLKKLRFQSAPLALTESDFWIMERNPIDIDYEEMHCRVKQVLENKNDPVSALKMQKFIALPLCTPKNNEENNENKVAFLLITLALLSIPEANGLNFLSFFGKPRSPLIIEEITNALIEGVEEYFENPEPFDDRENKNTIESCVFSKTLLKQFFEKKDESDYKHVFYEKNRIKCLDKKAALEILLKNTIKTLSEQCYKNLKHTLPIIQSKLNNQDAILQKEDLGLQYVVRKKNTI